MILTTEPSSSTKVAVVPRRHAMRAIRSVIWRQHGVRVGAGVKIQYAGMAASASSRRFSTVSRSGLSAARDIATTLAWTRRRTAQRVKAAQRPEGSALTQRRDTHARSWGVGKSRADLPSGVR